ncbi:MAG: MarR family transcriptional regulator [Pseudomonadota bacterium]|nr:MarR family transcriptional regulator [Pseudomonadota bacterium]
MTDSTLSDPRRLEDLLLYRLARLLAAGSVPVVRLCECEWGITRREWRVLAVLVRSEGCLSSSLAEAAGLDRTRTSRAVTRLADKGLVRREPRAGNRREVALFLTERGRKAHDELLPGIAAINRELVGALDADALRQLDGALARLQTQAEQLRAGHMQKARTRRA